MVRVLSRQVKSSQVHGDSTLTHAARADLAQSESIRSNQRQSEAIRGNQHAPISPRHPSINSIGSNPASRRSYLMREANRGAQRHSEVIRGTQRHSEALRGPQEPIVVHQPRAARKPPLIASDCLPHQVPAVPLVHLLVAQLSEVIRSNQRPSIAMRSSAYISSSSPPHAPRSTGAAPAAAGDPSVEVLAAVDSSAVPASEAPTAEALARDSIW